MLLAQLLIEVPDAQLMVDLLKQPQHLLRRGQRHPLIAEFVFPPIGQSGISMLFQSLAHRRIVRSVTPMISTACHHVIFFAIAFSSTSL